MISRLPRRALRAGFVSAVVGSSMLVASPAFAGLNRDDGDDPGASMSTLKVVLIFGGAPIGLFLLIALLVALPGIVKGPRYRPGKSWQGTPQWYGAPETAKPAIDPHSSDPHSNDTAAVGATAGAALTGTIITPDEADPADGGGTSARW